MKIIEFHDDIAHHFKAINEEWIVTYFELEPIDEEILNDPKSYILVPGGSVLFIQENNQILGTVALKKHTDQEVELTKMGVYPEFRNQGLGKKLIFAAINKAREMGFGKIILYSNRKLESAIYLYKKTGFKELSCYDDFYERCDIKMEMQL